MGFGCKGMQWVARVVHELDEKRNVTWSGIFVRGTNLQGSREGSGLLASWHEIGYSSLFVLVATSVIAQPPSSLQNQMIAGGERMPESEAKRARREARHRTQERGISWCLVLLCRVMPRPYDSPPSLVANQYCNDCGTETPPSGLVNGVATWLPVSGGHLALFIQPSTNGRG